MINDSKCTRVSSKIGDAYIIYFFNKYNAIMTRDQYLFANEIDKK